MEFPFSPYIALLEQCLAAREDIAGRLARQLFGARGKAAAQNGDREAIAQIFNDCFFDSPAISHLASGLNGRSEAAHLADGFEPARQDGYARELDAAELVLRACHHWDSTRWPGTNGRLVYAQSLYAVFILRQLQHLSLRIWDEGAQQAAERLQRVQRLLDGLNGDGRSPRAIRLVRDARWLVQTAQGPLTRHLEPYFVKAAHASALPDEVRLEIHRAGAVLAGGHLRSQLRHLSWHTGWAFDHPQLLALTRSSNSMDMALLVRDLVPLLDRYSAACERQDGNARLALADAIFQGLSADPELLLTRLDLLGPSTMIEDLFVDYGGTNFPRESPGSPGLLERSSIVRSVPLQGDRVKVRLKPDTTYYTEVETAPSSCSPYTALGEVHRECLARYGELIGRTAGWLRQDSRAFDPSHATYSPLGTVYGFCADLFSNMVLNTLRGPSSHDLSLEDVFTSHGRLEEKREQAHEWERLPRGDRERAPFERSAEWAAQMYARLASALETRAARSGEPNASRFQESFLYVVPRGVSAESLPDGVLPAGIVPAQEHCVTSDVSRGRMSGATALPASRLVADRADGRLLVCRYSDGAWFGVSKIPLTLYTSQGKPVLITDVPSGVIHALRSVCPELLVVIPGA